MEASCEGGQGPEGAVATYMEWRRLMGEAKAPEGAVTTYMEWRRLMGEAKTRKGL